MKKKKQNRSETNHKLSQEFNGEFTEAFVGAAMSGVEEEIIRLKKKYEKEFEKRFTIPKELMELEKYSRIGAESNKERR